MPKLNNFIEDFQKDHFELLNLVISFQKAIESINPGRTKDILTRIEDLANKHFNFEENYLYPRLRRLVVEITHNLHQQQQMVREFIKESRGLLDKNRLNKNKLSDILNVLPRLSKFFKDCNDLVFLIEKFDKKDRDDLNQRFKYCCGMKNLVTV